MSGGCSFSVKNKLKSEIFNGKTFYKTKMFFSAVTENLNWEVLTNQLLLKDEMGLRIKILIWGIH